MSRNGSGTYNLPAGNPVVTGTTITTTWANTTLNDIGSALTGSVAADGQTPMSGSLNMANNKVISVTDPTNAQDAATKAYVDLVAGGTKNGSFVNLAYTGTLTGGTGIVNLGSGQVYKDASGNVGIGTSSPLLPLVISNAGASGLEVSTTYIGGGAGTYIQSYNRSGAAYVPYGMVASYITFNPGNSAAEAMRITSTGNVGIGTSNPKGLLEVVGTGIATANNFVYIEGGNTGGVTPSASFNAGVAFGQNYSSGNSETNLIWGQGIGSQQYLSIGKWTGSAYTEQMRLDSSGNLLVGTTSYAAYGNGFSVADQSGTKGGVVNIGHASGVGTGAGYVLFGYNNGGIGAIVQNGTTAVSYNTTSDYRLKTNIAPITNALNTVNALNPISFTWVDGRKDDGFLAHELQSVIPNCVTGEKDAVEIVDDVDDEGKVIGTKEIPKYQQMDNSGVIPFLVKAIQEQQTMIEELKTKVLALEAK
jgi:hypothetical protein